MQYDTTINKWNPVKATHRINASNPCFPGDQRVATDKGWIAFKELIERVNQRRGVQGLDASRDGGRERQPKASPSTGLVLSSPTQYMITGVNDVFRVVFDNGVEIRATKNHRLWTVNRGYVAVEELRPSDRVLLADAPDSGDGCREALPVSSDWKGLSRRPAIALREMYFPDRVVRRTWRAARPSRRRRLGRRDRCFLGSTGAEDDARELMPRHRALLRQYVGEESVNECVQANGTRQLRVTRAPFRRFLAALGVERKQLA